ncbi:ephrin-B1-like isoform X2 [Tachypleus tridentatus]|uniref:ephrin-B1-like isoform X2 n=1 Tax=Tachypleus tridentatus TaxID=6853 RepID=UPI003FD28C9B
MPWIVVFLLLTLLDIVTLDVMCLRLDDIYWNASNPIFRIDNTDHIIDVNKGNIPFEYDQVNIICPVYTPGTDEDVETYIIYNVSKEEYDSCRINNPNPRVIAVCDKPHQLMYFTVTFRSFTPQPGGLEFKPGQDYYFISTSGGRLDQLNQRVGGRCASRNMKIVFKVCCDPTKKEITTATSSTVASATFPARKPLVTPSTTTTTTTVQPTSTDADVLFGWFNPRFPSKPPTIKTYAVPSHEDKKKIIPKKNENKDKQSKETRAKNEELVNNAAPDFQRIRVPVVSLVSLLIVIFQTR